MLIFIAKLFSQAKVAEILIFLDVLIYQSKYFNDNCSFIEDNNHIISSYQENHHFDKNLYYVKYTIGDLMLVIPLKVKII